MPDDSQPPIHARIADALARLGALARAQEQAGSTGEDLSPLQSRALVALLRRTSLRVGELAEELLVTYGTVSVALSTLDDKGLVTKFRDPDEHRAVRVELTRRGRGLAKRASEWTATGLRPGLDELDARETGPLLATLLKLILALERQGVIAAARMCVSCEHFVPDGGRGDRPHYCRLLDQPIGAADLRVDCPEHERAADDRLADVARSFDSTA